MTCDKVQELLTSYLDNELTEDEYLQISIHLEQCPECSVLIQYIKEMQNTFENIPEVDPPARIRQNVMKAIVKEENKAKDKSSWQWKRAIAAFILFAVSIATGLQPLFAMKNEADTASLRFSIENAKQGDYIQPEKVIENNKNAPNNNEITFFTTQIHEPNSSINEERSEDNTSNDDTSTDNPEESQFTITGVTDEDGKPVVQKKDLTANLKIDGEPGEKTLALDAPTIEDPKWYKIIPRERFIIAFSGVIFSLIMLWYSRPKKV